LKKSIEQLSHQHSLPKYSRKANIKDGKHENAQYNNTSRKLSKRKENKHGNESTSLITQQQK